MAPVTRESRSTNPLTQFHLGVLSLYVQDEAHPDPNVSFAGYELRSVQENGDLRTFRCLFLDGMCDSFNSVQNLQQSAR